MKYLQLQTDILKAAYKQDTRGKASPFHCGDYENKIAVIVDGCYMVFVPEDKFYLDISYVFDKPRDVSKMMRSENEAIDAYNTGMIRTVLDGRKVRVFSTDQEAEIWIAESNLKYFDLDKCTFKGSEKNKPLFIYEDTNLGSQLVGYILPVNHN